MAVDLEICIRKSSNTDIGEVNKVNNVIEVSYKGLNFTVILLLNLLNVPSIFVLNCKTYSTKRFHNLNFHIKRKLGGIVHSFLQLVKRKNA